MSDVPTIFHDLRDVTNEGGRATIAPPEICKLLWRPGDLGSDCFASLKRRQKIRLGSLIASDLTRAVVVQEREKQHQPGRGRADLSAL